MHEVIEVLENQSKLESHLRKLGSLHQKHGIKKQYLNVMGPILVQAIRPMLQAEGAWSSEVRITWLHFLKVICFHMKAGYTAEDRHSPIPSSIAEQLRQRRHTTNVCPVFFAGAAM